MLKIFLIYFLTSGDLIPRHQQVFRSNVFFSGVSIPDPDTTVRVLLSLRMRIFFSVCFNTISHLPLLSGALGKALPWSNSERPTGYEGVLCLSKRA